MPDPGQRAFGTLQPGLIAAEVRERLLLQGCHDLVEGLDGRVHVRTLSVDGEHGRRRSCGWTSSAVADLVFLRTPGLFAFPFVHSWELGVHTAAS